MKILGPTQIVCEMRIEDVVMFSCIVAEKSLLNVIDWLNCWVPCNFLFIFMIMKLLAGLFPFLLELSHDNKLLCSILFIFYTRMGVWFIDND